MYFPLIIHPCCNYCILMKSQDWKWKSLVEYGGTTLKMDILTHIMSQLEVALIFSATIILNLYK